MSLSFTLSAIRSLLLASGLLLSVWAANAQSTSGAFRPLYTAVNSSVADTVTGVALYVTITRNGSHGNVTKIPLGQFPGNIYSFKLEYQPNSGFTGRDTFIVELNTQGNFPHLIYQAYQVNIYPSLVTTRPDFALTPIGSSTSVNVLANDSGTQPPLQVSSIPLINHGTATINPNGTVSFAPTAGFSGIAHFNYVVCDALGNCKTESVNVSVANGPAVNDSIKIATAKNTPVTYPLGHSGYSMFQAPMHGSVLMQGSYVFRYQSTTNYAGSDQFILMSVNGGDTVYSHVFVDILNTPAPNKMTIEDFIYTPKNKPITFNVKGNDIGNLSVKGVILPTSGFYGTLNSWQGNGQMTFTPNAGFSGVVRFQYYVGNSYVANLETATVNVVVGNMNPTQGVFSLTTPKETPMVVNYKIPFLGYDFSVLDAPDNGQLELKPGFWSGIVNGQQVSGYNLLIYTPFADYVGPDELELNYCITSTNQCQSVKLEVDVTEINATDGPYCVDDCVWAGDVNYDGIVNNKDILPLGYFMGTDGLVRDDATLDWYGQYAENWANPYSGYPIDLKHADTNGDGKVTTADTSAVGMFYGSTHNLVPNIIPASKGLPFFMTLLTPPNPGPGDLVSIEVSLGNAMNPLANLYGFSFDVKLSPQIVDSAFLMTFYDNSWFARNYPNLNFQKRPSVGRLETAQTHTSGVANSGFGKVGRFDFIIITDVVDGFKSDSAFDNNLKITLEGGEGILADGTHTGLGGAALEIPLKLNASTSQTTAALDDYLFVYPSPAQDFLQVHLNGENQIQQMSVQNVMGAQVWSSGKVQGKANTVNVSNLANGMYFLVAQTEKGRIVKKFEVMKP